MDEEHDIVKVYSGTKITVMYLKGLLAEKEIDATIRDDFQTGVSGGVINGTPSIIHLYILDSDYKKAKPIIDQFLKENKE